MDNTEKKLEEAKVSEGLLELCIDQDHITITVERFEELINAEVTLDIIYGMHKILDSYDLKKLLPAVFGPAKVEDDDE